MPQNFKIVAARFLAAFLAGGLSTLAGMFTVVPHLATISDLKTLGDSVLVGFIFGGIFGLEKLALILWPWLNPFAPTVAAAVVQAQQEVDTKLGIPASQQPAIPSVDSSNPQPPAPQA